jgi:hypothetical protein
MEEEKLAEGTYVVSNSDSGLIIGKICGLATTQIPGIGYMYIINIETRSGKDWDKYPYSCCVLPKSMFLVTHSHPEGIQGAQATAQAIFMARMGSSKDEIRRTIQETYGYNLTRTCDDIRDIFV